MEAAHKTKITEAITLCESKMNSFFKHLEQVMGKPSSTKLAQHILAETYFAGGVFRSIIAGEQPNDIDVWFRSQDAMLEFKHMVYCSKKEIFFEITKNESFNWKSGNNKGPQLSFITKNYGHPAFLVEKFDFTFNQHYYSMNEFKLSIDVDTFSKKGRVNLDCNDTEGALLRSFRFMNEGWAIEERSLLDLVKRTSAKPDLVEMVNSSGQNKPGNVLDLVNKAYHENDYFGLTKQATAPAGKLLYSNMETLGYTTTVPHAWAQRTHLQTRNPAAEEATRRILDRLIPEAPGAVGRAQIGGGAGVTLQDAVHPNQRGIRVQAAPNGGWTLVDD